ncbi:MAG: FecR family protein [Chitinophagaceae bacterium]
MNKKEHFNQLLQLYVEGSISISEQDELFRLLASHQYDSLLEQHIENNLKENYNGKLADLPPHISQEIARNILAAEKRNTELMPVKRTFKLWHWAAAASVLLVISVAYYFLSFNKKEISFTAAIPANNVQNKNTSDSIQLIVLSDGSKITLQPNSILHYPEKFSDSSREVYLEGKAFFEVTRNPQKPFLVYSKHIITRVLGTSFFINTETASGNEEVSVRTGKVQVSENTNMQAGSKQLIPVIITPNQKAIYEPEKRLFETTIVEKPQPLIKEAHENESPASVITRFVYEQENLAIVFRQLERAYGIEIIPENPNLNNCVFTGDIADEDLFTILKQICLATKSTFEINGTKVLIKGDGCNKN